MPKQPLKQPIKKPVKPALCANDEFYCPDCSLPCPVRVRTGDESGQDEKVEDLYGQERQRLRDIIKQAKSPADVADAYEALYELEHDKRCRTEED
jgi:hypothetical protein